MASDSIWQPEMAATATAEDVRREASARQNRGQGRPIRKMGHRSKGGWSSGPTFPTPDAGVAVRDYAGVGTIPNGTSIPQIPGTSITWRTEEWLGFAPLIVSDNSTFNVKVFRIGSSSGVFSRSVGVYGTGITNLNTSGVTMVTRMRPVSGATVTVMSFDGTGPLASTEGIRQNPGGVLGSSSGNTFAGTSFGNWYTIVSKKAPGPSTWSHFCVETGATIVGIGSNITSPNFPQVHFCNSDSADHCGLIIWYRSTVSNAEALAAANFYFGIP